MTESRKKVGNPDVSSPLKPMSVFYFGTRDFESSSFSKIYGQHLEIKVVEVLSSGPTVVANFHDLYLEMLTIDFAKT